MTTKKKRLPGRPALDGAASCTERINAVITPEHKRMLDWLSYDRGISVWLRETIETAYKKQVRK